MKEVCRTDDAELTLRGWKAFECFNGRPGIIVNDGGAYHAFINKCPHAAGEVYPVEGGGTQLKCNQHGSLFDFSGLDLTGPAAGMSLRALQLTIQDGVIYYS